MPTKTQKKRKRAKRKAKEAQCLDGKQIARLREGAFKVYGCACAWCQWREYCMIARKGDPGIGLVDAPVECKEPITVKHRAEAKRIAEAVRGA